MSTHAFREWFKKVVAHFKIGKIPYEDWALPIYVACRDRANRALRHLSVDLLDKPDATDMVLTLLSEEFVRPPDERVDEARKRYENFKREFGMKMRDYVHEFEIREAVYFTDDPGTVYLETTRAKRLLDGACLRDYELATIRAFVNQEWNFKGIRDY
jgi:hypothetical protein